MPDYTVLLLYPDYLGTDNPRGFETYCGHGTGSPTEAIAQVRRKPPRPTTPTTRTTARHQQSTYQDRGQAQTEGLTDSGDGD